MRRNLKILALLTFTLGISAKVMAQRIEVDPLLVDDTKRGPASSLKLIEVEFQVVTIDLGRVRSADMDRIRGLFGLSKSAVPVHSATPYGLSGRVIQKLPPVASEGAIKHQVLETKTFHELLDWMADRHIASFFGHEGRKIALGSTVVMLDQRVSAPRLSKKKDPRTGEDIHAVNFVQSGLHLELTPLSQVFPKQKEPGEIWQLRLDRVFTTIADDDEKSESKIDRSKHMVKLAVGQTALIPDFVKTDRPAFVLLSVKSPKRKPGPRMTMLTPTGEVIRLSKDPGGPGLADRISKTLTANEGSPTPRLYKPENPNGSESKPVLVLASDDPANVTGSSPARPRGKQAGVVQRRIKESEIPFQQGARVLEVHEQEIVLVSFPDEITDLTTDGDKGAIERVDVLVPDSLVIRAGKKGVGSLSVKSGKKSAGRRNTFRIEVIVRGDTRLLSHTLDKLFPNDPVELTEVNDALVIRGKVSRAAVAKQVVEVAEQFYPRILDQMDVRDLEPIRTGSNATDPKGAPAIGTEIRELRTDVKSLRDEIQKLIKVMENQAGSTKDAD